MNQQPVRLFIMTHMTMMSLNRKHVIHISGIFVSFRKITEDPMT